MSLLYFSIYKYSTAKLVHHVIIDASVEKNLQSEVEKIIANLKNMELNPEERQKFTIKNTNLNWSCKIDGKDICYLAKVSTTYPERFVYGLF